MTPPTFEAYFAAMHGYGPFPWQAELATRLALDTPLSSITAPTGLGKTAAIDAWLWALASDIDRSGSDRRVPIRSVFVVDRRVIVDAAWEHSRKLAERLVSPDDPVLIWMRDRLLSAGHDLVRPLDVVRMRGGVSWGARWLRQPDQPAVVCGTVDQFGSRFLFRGYGVSDRMRPVDAALVGHDSIAFLDEAHLSRSLVKSVTASTELEAGASGFAGRLTTIVPMTATPSSDDRFPLTTSAADRVHPVAGPRLSAVKRARLVTLDETTPAKAQHELSTDLARTAGEIAAAGATVLVVCNTIAMARATHTALSAHADVDSVLSIGRCRELDKELGRAVWWDRVRAGRDDRLGELGRGIAVVATQTVEVGADLDVDVLVSEAAPLDALIQRFGRVDRLGAVGSTDSILVYHPLRSSSDRDLVYGRATQATWEWLLDRCESSADGLQIDMGVSALASALADLGEDERGRLIAVPPTTPVLDAHWLDLLACTDPTNVDWLGVDTFLHGIRDEQPTVSVVWRADLGVPVDASGPSGDNLLSDGAERDRVARQLASNPPTTEEAVDIPVAHLARFLAGARIGAGEDNLADQDLVDTPLDALDDRRRPAETRVGWILTEDGAATPVPKITPAHHHRLLVLPADAGGHDLFGWDPSADGPVADIADLVGDPTGPVRLRVDRAVLASLGIDVEPDSPLGQRWTMVADLVRDESGDLPEAIHGLIDALKAASVGSHYAEPLLEVLDRLGTHESWRSTGASGTDAAVHLASPASAPDRSLDEVLPESILPTLILRAGRVPAREILDNDDSAGSSATGVEVTLDQHLGAVGDRALAFAERLGLPDAVSRAIELAGRAHDLGKIDPRFQTMLRGGDWLAAATSDGDRHTSLAKSTRGVARPRARRSDLPDEWRWPSGHRHEAVSLALIADADVPADVDRDLVEHLVASHHGWARPRFPAIVDDNQRVVSVGVDGRQLSAASDRALYDDRVRVFRTLCHRYGWWGLAALESVVRLADMAVSEEGS